MALSGDRLFDSVYAKDAIAAYAKVYPVSSGALTTGYVVTVHSDGTLKFAPASGGLSSPVGPTDGGTGLTTYAKGDVLYASATNVLAKLAGATGHDGWVLTWNDTTGVPEWRVGSGGSGTLAGDTDVAISSPTDRDLLIYHSSDAKWHNDVLVAADIPSLDAAKITTGTLAIARGGTNIGTYTVGDLLYCSATNVLSKLAIGSTGKVLTVSSGVPAWVDISSGGGGGVLPTWVAFSPDNVPGSANSEDDEFDSSSLDAKWTATTTSCTADYDTTWRSHAYAKFSAASGTFGLQQNYSPAGAFSLTAKIRIPVAVNTGMQALLLASDGSNNAVYAKWFTGSGIGATVVMMTQDTGAFTDRGGGYPVTGSFIYLHLQRLSAGNNWEVWYSTDGYSFAKTTTFSKSMTVSKIAFSINNGSGGYAGLRVGVDWFRRDWITLT